MNPQNYRLRTAELSPITRALLGAQDSNPLVWFTQTSAGPISDAHQLHSPATTPTQCIRCSHTLSQVERLGRSVAGWLGCRATRVPILRTPRQVFEGTHGHAARQGHAIQNIGRHVLRAGSAWVIVSSPDLFVSPVLPFPTLRRMELSRLPY